jgi:replication factor A1
MNDKNSLTSNTIKQLFSLKPGSHDNLNFILQVTDLKEFNSQKHAYTATLSDSEEVYKGFVFIVAPGVDPLHTYDVIKLRSIKFMEEKKLFVVQKYEILSKHSGIISSPPLIDVKPKVNNQDNIDVQPHIGEDIHMVDSISHTQENQFTPIKAKARNITPLKQLTTFSKDFKIQVRVIKKSDVKNYSTQNKAPGSVFSFVIQDENGDEMQITCFNKAVNKFYELIKENKIFEITGGYVKINDRKFTSVKSEYKIVIDENTKVVELDDDGSINQQKFDFVKLSELSHKPLYSVIDVIGYVKICEDLVVKQTKNGEQPMKKLIIVDNTGWKAECSLWRLFAHTEVCVGQIITLKNVKIGEFNGRNVSTFDESVVILDPPYLKEAEVIRNFVENFTGEYKTFNSKDSMNHDTNKQYTVTYLKDVLEMVDDTTHDDKISNMKIKATVTQLIHNDKNFYAGCLDINCKKKLHQDQDRWSCLSCNKTYAKPCYYYTLSIRVKDCSFEYWIDMLGNVAERFMNMSAEAYKDILYCQNDTRLRLITNDIEFKTFLFNVRPKLHYYNSVPKKKLYVNRTEPVDTVNDANRLVWKLKSDLNL